MELLVSLVDLLLKLKEDLFVFVSGITRAIAAVRLSGCIQDLTVDPLEVQRVRNILIKRI
jgi:hypothetical protein